MGVVFTSLSEGDDLKFLYWMITIYAAPVVYLLGIASSYLIEALLRRYRPDLSGWKALLTRVLCYGIAGGVSTTLCILVTMIGGWDFAFHTAPLLYACGIFTSVLYSLMLSFSLFVKRMEMLILFALVLPFSYLVIWSSTGS